MIVHYMSIKYPSTEYWLDLCELAFNLFGRKIDNVYSSSRVSNIVVDWSGNLSIRQFYELDHDNEDDEEND